MVQKRTDFHKSDLYSLTNKVYKGSKEETTYLFSQLQSLKHTGDSLKISSTTGVI